MMKGANVAQHLIGLAHSRFVFISHEAALDLTDELEFW